jgi:hypothetical protein
MSQISTLRSGLKKFLDRGSNSSLSEQDVAKVTRRQALAHTLWAVPEGPPSYLTEDRKNNHEQSKLDAEETSERESDALDSEYVIVNLPEGTRSEHK